MSGEENPRENYVYTSNVDDDEDYRKTMNLAGSTASDDLRRSKSSKKQKKALRK